MQALFCKPYNQFLRDPLEPTNIPTDTSETTLAKSPTRASSWSGALQSRAARKRAEEEEEEEEKAREDDLPASLAADPSTSPWRSPAALGCAVGARRGLGSRSERARALAADGSAIHRTGMPMTVAN
ncbi:unnamed protein product [Prorocentrum cordatum]|uniref:Uncharacterized protein n=1 Tax=Prorocentrum cordatum TaxID=2364126 RepID=A0ABN9RX51_9DINO|nr:unnamed protein product [Polarella glacialis]